MVVIGIGRLAELTGVKISTIRFYEQNDLVPPMGRTEGGQRRYDESAVRRLHFIRHARDLGFNVEDIRQLLSLSEHPAMPCDTAADIARHHLRQVEGKIARLRLIRSELKCMIEARLPTVAFWMHCGKRWRTGCHRAALHSVNQEKVGERSLRVSMSHLWPTLRV
jgi:DNA-binding transcriptional MerR regulator